LASVFKEAGIKIYPSKKDQLLAAIKKITGTATEGFLRVGDFGLGKGSRHLDDVLSELYQFYRVNNTSKTGRETSFTEFLAYLAMVVP